MVSSSASCHRPRSPPSTPVLAIQSHPDVRADPSCPRISSKIPAISRIINRIDTSEPRSGLMSSTPKRTETLTAERVVNMSAPVALRRKICLERDFFSGFLRPCLSRTLSACAQTRRRNRVTITSDRKSCLSLRNGLDAVQLELGLFSAVC
jgi:hypothetical protein